MKNPAECAGEEFGRNLSTLRAERVSGLGQASDLEVALGTLLQHEVQRIEQKYGPADPRRLRVAAREAANLELINRFEVERQVYQVDVPEVAEDGALIHGRVVDEQELALSGLVACLVDDRGKPMEESQDSPVDANGYFAIALTGQDVEFILERQPGVLLGIVTTRGSLVYQDLKSRKLAKGAEIFAEIALVRNEVLEGGTVIRPPRPGPGPRTVKVPDVTGETEDAAMNLIKEAGLSVGARETEPAPDKVGIVLAQSPAAGTEVKPKTPVDLVVGAKEAVEVPRLVGIPIEEAERKIKVSRLKRGEVKTRPSEQVDIVLEQDPAEGTEVAPGTLVDLVVGAGAKDVEVPKVVGVKMSTARRRVKTAKLTVGQIRTESGTEADRILAQDPAAGTKVPAGTPVDLVVSTLLSVPRAGGDGRT
jgi:beta-lactam-binding protein with PASTA domain